MCGVETPRVLMFRYKDITVETLRVVAKESCLLLPSSSGLPSGICGLALVTC